MPSESLCGIVCLRYGRWIPLFGFYGLLQAEKGCRVLEYLHGPGLSAILIASGGSSRIKIVGRNFHETTFRSFSDSDCDPVYLCQRHYGGPKQLCSLAAWAFARRHVLSYSRVAAEPGKCPAIQSRRIQHHVGQKGPTERASCPCRRHEGDSAQNVDGPSDDETIIGWMHGDEPDTRNHWHRKGYGRRRPGKIAKTFAHWLTTLTVPSAQPGTAVA